MRNLLQKNLLYALLVISLVSTVQLVRDLYFEFHGLSVWQERSHVQLPIRLGATVVDVRDTFPHLKVRNIAATLGDANVLVDGRQVLHADSIEIRQGLTGTSPYRPSATMMEFANRNTGQVRLLVGALKWSAEGHHLFRLLEVRSDGEYTVRTLSTQNRTESYPVYRALKSVGLAEGAIYRYAYWTFLPGFFLQAIAPPVTLVVTALTLYRRKRRAASQVQHVGMGSEIRRLTTEKS